VPGRWECNRKGGRRWKRGVKADRATYFKRRCALRGVSGVTLITGLSFPYGVAISGNELFVANEGSGVIGEYVPWFLFG